MSLYDGTCDQTKELDTLSGTMPNDDKWVISSSGHHMFVSFSISTMSKLSRPGFLAKIHYGNEINNIKICTSKKHSFIFSQLCKCNQWTNWILCLSSLFRI